MYCETLASDSRLTPRRDPLPSWKTDLEGMEHDVKEKNNEWRTNFKIDPNDLGGGC